MTPPRALPESGGAVDPIIFAIPVFFALIGVEVAIAHFMRRDVYRFNDAIADLSCGVVQQVLKFVIVIVSGFAYKAVHANFAFFEMSSSDLWVWLFALFAVDFCYYWFHRLSHEVNFLWAAHVVHHQSEEYNLAVALRQGALQPGFSWAFYVPLAFLGVPPLVFYTLASINTLYQFWIHTRLIRRMGPLEWLFNTPSHHRVHHGQNPQYIDRNHAGMFIVWDKLFGTFEPEGEEVVYGVTEPLESWSPIYANLHTWRVTLDRARRTRRVADKVRLFLKPPGWLPDDLAGDKPERAWPPPKYDTPVSRAALWYVFAQFGLVVAAMPFFLAVKASAQVEVKSVAAALIVVTVASLGGLLDGRGWARRLEQVRLLLVGLGATWILATVGLPAMVVAPVCSAVALGSLGWLSRVRGPEARPEAARWSEAVDGELRRSPGRAP